ncbi:MAG: HEAT repeat domain-containing protein [Elusimicrobiota bacterium]
MKKKLRCIFIYATLLLLSSTPVIDADNTRAIYFDTALDSYLNGKVDQAIEDLELALELEPSEPEKVKAFLAKLLVESGVKLYQQGNKAEGIKRLNRASNILPNDPSVKQMNTWMKQEQERLNSGAQQPQAQRNQGSSKSEPPKELLNQLKTFQTQQDTLMQTYIKDKEQYEKLIGKLDEERAMLIKALKEEKQNKNGNYINELLTSSEVLISGISIALLLLIYFIYTRIRSGKRERDFEILLAERETQIGNKIAEIKKSFDAAALAAQQSQAEHELSKEDKYLQERIKSIEVIESELPEESEIAERLLEEFLADNNIRVRIRAIEALYPHNEIRALDMLWDIAHSTDLQAHYIVIDTLATTKSPRALLLLTKFLGDDDEALKRKVFQAITRILERKPEWLPEDTRKKVSEVMKKVKHVDGWIG